MAEIIANDLEFRTNQEYNKTVAKTVAKSHFIATRLYKSKKLQQSQLQMKHKFSDYLLNPRVSCSRKLIFLDSALTPFIEEVVGILVLISDINKMQSVPWN